LYLLLLKFLTFVISWSLTKHWAPQIGAALIKGHARKAPLPDRTGCVRTERGIRHMIACAFHKNGGPLNEIK